MLFGLGRHFDDCLDDSCKLKGLVELTGTYNSIKKLNSGAKNFIINYEMLISKGNLIANFVVKIEFILF